MNEPPSTLMDFGTNLAIGFENARVELGFVLKAAAERLGWDYGCKKYLTCTGARRYAQYVKYF
jgi:hypothetical protein